jgi:aminomethyltransferase
MIDRGIPRHDYPIQNASGEVIGRVTSGTMSPSMQKAIGLGYVTKTDSEIETEVFIEIRKKAVKAKIVKLPFYRK